ncbi:MAG: cell division protein FtsA [Armatimonadetes bacterium]|nr:cell division protein FtsA [Armatimonadota bacterium]
MAKSEILAGLDIGSSKVCTTVAEVYQNGRVDIIGVGLVPCCGLKRGVVVDMDATASAIRESVDQAQRVSGAEIQTALVSVTGEHISSLNSPGRVAVTQEDHEVRREHVERVLSASRVIVLPPERDIIHAIPRGFTVDGQGGIKDPVGMAGRRLEVETHIVTGATSFLQNVTKSVAKAGIEAEGLVLGSIASAMAVTNQEERELGVGVMDIGGGTTDIAVLVDGEVYYTAVVPVGGNHITHDVAVGLQTSQEEAEKAKKTAGCARTDMVEPDEVFEVAALGSNEPRQIPRHILAQLIEPRVEEIFELARREIERSGFLGMLPMGIAITGGSALLPGMAETASKVLGTTARIEAPRGVGGMVDSIDSPIYSTSVGLVMYAARHRLSPQEDGKASSLFASVVTSLRRLFG